MPDTTDTKFIDALKQCITKLSKRYIMSLSKFSKQPGLSASLSRVSVFVLSFNMHFFVSCNMQIILTRKREMVALLTLSF